MCKRRRLWLAALFGLLPGFSLACVPSIPGPYRGFVHAASRQVRHLPSNAQGVVFAWNHPTYGLMIKDASGIRELDFVGAIPPRPAPGSFVLKDLTMHRRVPAKLTPVPLDQASLGDGKIYLPHDPVLRACIQESLLVDGRTCMDAARATKLLAKHRLRDVTLLVEERYGSYFVAPAKGFIPGHAYSIHRSSDGEIWRFPDNAQVVIDQLPLVPESARQAMLVSTWQRVAGVSANQRNAVVSFRLPRAWQPYRDSLQLRVYAYPPVIYPGPWSDCRPQGSVEPDGEDSVVIDDDRCHEMVGSVGFQALGMPDMGIAMIRVCPAK